MPAVTIRNLSEETRRALKLRAARNDRSMEAEMRALLDAAVMSETKPPPVGATRNGVPLLPVSNPDAVVTLEIVNRLRDEAP